MRSIYRTAVPDMVNATHSRCALMILLFLGTICAAQGQQAPSTQDTTAVTGEPEILFVANITADELTFHEVGNGDVGFHGTNGLDTLHLVTRTNLPTPVQPGVTYRDIGVRLVISCSLPELERIIEEAMRELEAESLPENAPSESDKRR